MAILPIYNCSHSILKQKTKQIEQIDENIRNLVRDMFETMRNTKKGVGLAANQVGKDVSLIVIDLKDVEGYETQTNEFVLINPEIIEYSEETDIYYEGCLSVPDFYEDVERSLEVKIKYLDLENNEIELHCTDFLARVVQHEIDHLNGILFYEKLSAFKRTLNKNKIKNVISGNYSCEYEMIN